MNLIRLNFLDRIPFSILIIISVSLGLAPFTPEPHLMEKARMLFHGQLSRPIDIFDLFLHGTAPLLLLAKGVRQVFKEKKRGQ
ncbi:MAG: RND transporter [Desulfobacteraceae bacterium]|nr:MAG: RND transporter [Desulfobacteraceae bacterium]